MEFIVSFLLFTLAVYGCFYIPGKILMGFFPEAKNKEDLWVPAWAVGVAVFLFISYVTAWGKMTYVTFALIVLCVVYAVWKRKTFQFLPQSKSDSWSSIIIIIGSLVFTSFTFLSGLVTKNGEQFFVLNALDGIMHLAYIKSQVISFPPMHPEVWGTYLRGYHYFYDFLLSRFALFFGISPENLLFRFFPIFTALLYGSSFYWFVRKITNNLLSQRFILFLIYFGEGFGYFLSFIRSDFNGLTAQSLDLILDPSMVLSLSLFVVALGLLPQVGKSLRRSIVLGILLGILTQLKVYVGITGIVVLCVYVLFHMVRRTWKERIAYCMAILVTGGVTAVTFLPNNFGAGSLIYAPFNLYNQFIQQAFFTKLHWGERFAIYQSHHNVLRIAQLEIEAIGLYWIINLGIRLVFLKDLLFVRSKKLLTDDLIGFIVIILGVTTFIPSFFLQSPSPFDVMQFTWIALIFFNIPAGITIGNFVANKPNYVKIFIFSVIIVLSIPYLIAMERIYVFSKPQLLIPQQQLSVFQKLTITIGKDSYYTVLPDRLTYRTKDNHLVDKLLWYSAPLTSALSGRSVYYESNITPDISLATISKKRIATMFVLSDAIQNCDMKSVTQVIQKIHSKYLLTYYPQPCLATSSAVLTKLQTQKYSFYQFK